MEKRWRGKGGEREYDTWVFHGGTTGLSCCALRGTTHVKAMHQGGSQPTTSLSDQLTQLTDLLLFLAIWLEADPVRETRRCPNKQGEGRGEKPACSCIKIRPRCFFSRTPTHPLPLTKYMQERARRRPITSQRPVQRSDACEKTKKEGVWMDGWKGEKGR